MNKIQTKLLVLVITYYLLLITLELIYVPVSCIDANDMKMLESSNKPISMWKILIQRFEVTTSSNIRGNKD